MWIKLNSIDDKERIEKNRKNCTQTNQSKVKNQARRIKEKQNC